MTFAAVAERHARSIVFVALALAFAGAVLAASLPVGLFPQVSFPRAVVISLDAGDRPAGQMAVLVTRPVEEAVPGDARRVLNVRSRTTRGASCRFSIDFELGPRHGRGTTLNVDSAIAKGPAKPAGRHALRRAPDGSDGLPDHLLRISVEHPVLRSNALRDLAQYRIVPLLSAIPGLARGLPSKVASSGRIEGRGRSAQARLLRSRLRRR